MRISPEAGSIEVGHICLSPSLQRTRAASEMVFLLADWVFREGYRRFEWKCDALNRPSRRAAQRFGFSFEGVFRQHLIVKGRNRDTAWFAMTDGDWACLRPAWAAWLDPANFDAAGRQRRALGALTAPCRAGSDPAAVTRERGPLRRLQRRWKDGWIADPDGPGARRSKTIDMLLFDHGLLRKAWRNEHEVAPGVWRSSQPDPGMIRRLAAQGVKAIVNLRGATEWGSYFLEREACRAAGIELVDFKLNSRKLPSREELLALDALFERLPKPFLMHCKSGADRAGFAAALYLLLRGDMPVEEAQAAALLALPAPARRGDRGAALPARPLRRRQRRGADELPRLGRAPLRPGGADGRLRGRPGGELRRRPAAAARVTQAQPSQPITQTS